VANRNSAYSAPILFKAFAVLEEVAQNQSALGVSDLSRRLEISKSTIYGIANALTELGALRQDKETKKYRLGPTLFRLGNQVLAGVDLRAVVRPFMEQLIEELEETVFIGTFDKNGITIIDKLDSPQDLKISAPIGTRIPVHAGAAGKIFFAHLQEQLLAKILAERPLPQYTEESIIDPGKYRKELDKVRRQGYATDFEEYIQGVNAVSVPILDNRGSMIAALWIVGFSRSLNREKMDRAIRAAITAAAGIKERLKG
jgi:DNA-binding IclR family transcriptional regulator